MKPAKQITLFAIASTVFFSSCIGYINVQSSEKDSKVFIDGKEASNNGFYRLAIKRGDCKTVKITKDEFISQEKKYCFSVPGSPRFPDKENFILKRDESFDASVKSDIANSDFTIEVNKKFNVDAAWKAITQIVTEHFDEIQNSSKETGYLTTAWKIYKFPGRVVRTRIVVKNSSENPLSYKVKICSESSLQEGVSIKDDEKFSEWDRVLKKYQDVISEFQNRIGIK